MKSNTQSAEIFRISSAFGLWKSSKSFANLIAFLICILFSANTQAQDADVPVPTITNTTANLVCGETVNLTAGGVSFIGYKCHWFRDAACTDEINTGVSGTYRENLAITITDGLTIYCRLRKDETKTVTTNFSYTGNEQVYSVPVDYKSFTFQVWGAQGGGSQECGRGGTGGKGGYSVGTLNATSGISSISVYVGGMGSCSPSGGGRANGGWNGGGTSWGTNDADPAAGGGGGSDIRINGNTFYHRIIVAGGGGGGGEDGGDASGYGGGTSGANESGANHNENGGSQTSAGKGGDFGHGANTRCDGGGGGGGWYGGGAHNGTLTIPTGNDACDAGGGSGGSGYVYTSSTASNYPSGCRLNSSLYLTNAQTIAGNTSFPATGGGNETGHSGNGYARIITTYYPTGRAGSITLHSYVDDPTSAADAAGCGSATVSAVAPDGCAIDWYDAPTGGNLLAQGSDTYTATVNGTYYAESYKSAGCVSEHRVTAEATVWNFNGGTVSGFDQEVQGTAVNVPISTTPATGRSTIEYQWYMNGVAISGATTENYTIPSATVAGLAVGDYLFTRKAKNNCNSGTYELASGSFRLVIVSPSGGTDENCGNGLVLYCAPDGSDSNPGSTTEPMDIVTALTTAGNYSSRTADDPAIIRMAAGEYTVDGTTLNLVDNLIIDGGWDVTSAGVWTKGTDETKIKGSFGTTDNGNANHRIAIRSDGKQNWKLQDLSIDVTGFNSSGGSDYHLTSYKGNSVYGLYMTGASAGDSLVRVKITVHDGGKGGKTANYASAAANGNSGNGQTAGVEKNVSGITAAMKGKSGGKGGNGGKNGKESEGYGIDGDNGTGASGSYGHGGAGGQAINDNGTHPGNGKNGQEGISGSNSGLNDDYVDNKYEEYFNPGRGCSGSNGTGGGGGGGGGGSCGCGTYSPKKGAAGGGGGSGGVGGFGGAGGSGGGGSFGIYCYNFNIPKVKNIQITVGTSGNGSEGQPGQVGGDGGNGGDGQINPNGCDWGSNDNKKGGKGGKGGNGANGANGGNGPDGDAFKIAVIDGTSVDTTNVGYGTLPSPILTSIDYGISSKKGCTNSQIALTRSGGSWNGNYGTLIKDETATSSSYSTSDNEIIVGYTATGSFAPTSDSRKVFITQARSIGEIDGTDEFDAGESGNYLYDESLSSGDVMYWSVVSADGATQGSSVAVYDGTNATNTFTANSAELGLAPGEYYIKLEVDNNCCGLSVPIWKSITVNEPSLLPIELTSFSAECDGKSSLVEWTTATERNNDHFVLERSDDAVNFAEIARVIGAGNSIEPLDYTYTDYDIRNGDNYYRLWQVDYDGTRTASEIIVATCIDETVDAPEVLAYPNPFSGELTVVLENFGNSKARIEIIDMLGKVVKEITVDNPHNSKEVVLHLDEIPAQAYNIRIRTKDFVINKQVIKN